MANVTKLCELIFGANPSDDDLREIIRRVDERLPKPIIETPETSNSAADDKVEEAPRSPKNKK